MKGSFDRALQSALAVSGMVAIFLLLTAAAQSRQVGRIVPASVGAVFSETNQTNNQILYYTRQLNGTLTLVGKYSTQGQGYASEHASQGSVAISQDRKFLYAANYGSSDVTAFSVSRTGLTFVGRYSSGGTNPFSIAIYGNLLYVLNFGDPQNVYGFLRNADGSLTPLNSSQPVSGLKVQALQVGFTNNGKALVVTEEIGESVDTYLVNSSGTINPGQFQPSAGRGPFGFAFDQRNHLLVSEALTSSMSSYHLAPTGIITPITGELDDFGRAACWVAVTNYPGAGPQYAYVTNTKSDTLSGYSVSSDGTLALLNPSDGITYAFPTGAFPLDEGIDQSNSYLYVLAQRAGSIYVFNINADGSVAVNSITKGLPTGSFGIVAY